MRDLCPKSRRRKEARPDEILAAARAVFVECGFAAARVEEIAAKAGASKGTVYLYFPTKEALFEAVMQADVLPIIEQAHAMLSADPVTPAPEQLRYVLDTFYRELVATDRRRLLHLMIAEGPRFPWLSEFYHRTFVSKGSALIAALIRRGVERGEFTANGLDEFPKIVVGPAILAALYCILFAQHKPLELERYKEVHLGAVLRALGVAEEGQPGIYDRAKSNSGVPLSSDSVQT